MCGFWGVHGMKVLQAQSEGVQTVAKGISVQTSCITVWYCAGHTLLVTDRAGDGFPTPL